MTLVPVILSGGVGSRLWPLSREDYPKQLLNLCGANSLLQDTVTRLDGLPDKATPLVVCNEIHRFLVAEQLRNIGVHTPRIILEPVGRNTAPAVAAAAFYVFNTQTDALILILPSDHLIAQTETFRRAVEAAIPLALNNYLVTFGIVPTRPETGYGYIKAAAQLGETVGFAVENFVEKPDLPTAEQFLSSGDYYWNSGMFLFKAKHYLLELQKFAPDIFGACRQAVDNAIEDKDFFRLDEASFRASPSNSIDYAVMEHTESAAVVPLDAGWNDVGAWSSLWDVSPHDDNGNCSTGDVLVENVHNCYLRAEHRLIAAVGLENHIVIETADAVLVAHKDQVQDVKMIVERLKQSQRTEANLHRKVYRPWGSYENIQVEPRYQVKHIIVKPGASLSLQMHYHRAEHWIIVKGTAQITRDTERFVLSENQSTYIPLGVKHRLANPGKLPLELIEIQAGSYLGEDDIVRFEDAYGRIKNL